MELDRRSKGVLVIIVVLLALVGTTSVLTDGLRTPKETTTPTESTPVADSSPTATAAPTGAGPSPTDCSDSSSCTGPEQTDTPPDGTPTVEPDDDDGGLGGGNSEDSEGTGNDESGTDEGVSDGTGDGSGSSNPTPEEKQGLTVEGDANPGVE